MNVLDLARAIFGLAFTLGLIGLAAWAARSYQIPQTIRASNTLFPADRLRLLGSNLASAWAALKNGASAEWDRTLAMVRLGLGDSVDNVLVTPDPGGGNVWLSLKFKGFADPFPAANLSDGQLSWLGFVALVRLNPGRTLLAMDEPELHLHPQLIGGVVSLLASVDASVVLATHSDRVLELLDDPAAAVRVCSLGEGGAATLATLNPDELQKWLVHFGDLGRLRAAGYLERVQRTGPSAGE